MELYNKLSKICKTKECVNLKTLCSIHIGGVGDYVCYPKTTTQVKNLVNYLVENSIPYYVIGNGTNIIFEDGRISSVLVCLKELCGFTARGNTITALAGTNLFAFNQFCKINGLGGAEWSYGIPASIGGAVCMNAGAYGGEIKDIVKYVWVLRGGKIVKLTNTQMGFGYRKSVVQTTKDIILRVCFKLKPKSEEEIDQKQKQIFAYRKSCQPYGTFNAGSIFKKSNGVSAGKTIDKLGLKGVKIGDIEINNLHANFFVNLGNGTCKDLQKLIDYVKQVVKNEENIDLEEEVIFVK